jgi:hypothetical protein
MVLEPTFRLTDAGEPLVAAFPLTVTAAWLSFVVGVTVTVEAA